MVKRVLVGMVLAIILAACGAAEAEPVRTITETATVVATPSPISDPCSPIYSCPTTTPEPTLSPAETALIRWAENQYENAGLDVPNGITYTFDRNACRRGVQGFVYVSVREITICTPLGKSKFVLLHEIGHIWLRVEVDQLERRVFMLRLGLSHWNAGPYKFRGDEVAAELLAIWLGRPDGWIAPGYVYSWFGITRAPYEDVVRALIALGVKP